MIVKKPFTACCALVLLMAAQGYTQDGNEPFAYSKKIAAIKTILILPVEFDCYHLTAGGIREYDDSVSNAARTVLVNQIERTIIGGKFKVLRLPDDQVTAQSWLPFRRFSASV